MPTFKAYHAGMKKNQDTVQLTVRGLPRVVASRLKNRAEVQGKSLNRVVVEALMMTSGLGEQPFQSHDLDWIAGTWVEDPGFDQAVASFRVIDEELWR